MGCLIAIIASITPRTIMVVAFLLTDWFTRAFDTRLWPILGFVFMPYSTLAYMAAMINNNHRLAGGWMAIFIIAIIADISHWGGGGRTYRRRSRR